MNAVKVAQISTNAPAQVVVRDARGHKLFDIKTVGINITIATPPNAEIKIVDGRSRRWT